MYLSNKDLKSILNEMAFETPNPDLPFNPDSQIQICSIDLRLSNEFWKQRKLQFPVDLHKSKLSELSPRRHWKKVVLPAEQSITLKPNEFILGHTYEKFTVPPRYAGKINTRSSFARMGLETNSATDFINPGWRGFVPLEIINKSRNTIKIYPYMGIAQIMLISLTSEPDIPYGNDILGSKYQNDDGGPSYWWRDKLFNQIKKNYISYLPENALSILVEKFNKVDDLGLYRFEKFSEKLQLHEIDNAEDIIQKFCSKERKLANIQRTLLWFLPALEMSFVGLSLKFAFDNSHNYFHYVAWSIAILGLIPVIYHSFFREKIDYYEKI